VLRTVRLLAQLTRQVALVQYPSLTRSAVRHIELVPLAPQRLLLVLITDSGRGEQRAGGLPEPIEEAAVAHLRAVLNACLDGRRLAEAASLVVELPDRVQHGDRHNAAAVFSVILGTLLEHHEGAAVGSAAG